MTSNGTDQVKMLTELLLAEDVHPAADHTEAKDNGAFCAQVSGKLVTAIQAHTAQGAELRGALGVELSETTRTGKHLRAAMDAFTTTEANTE